MLIYIAHEIYFDIFWVAYFWVSRPHPNDFGVYQDSALGLLLHWVVVNDQSNFRQWCILPVRGECGDTHILASGVKGSIDD